jgi:hypothetical protein
MRIAPGFWALLSLTVLGLACEPGDVEDDDDGKSAGAGASGGATSSTNSTHTTNGSGGQTPSGLTCGELWQCYGGCQDNACGQQCYDQASPEAQQQDDALYACLVTHGCQDFACVEQNCPSEYAACFGTPPQTSGSASSTTTTTSGGQTWWKCTAQGVYTCCQDQSCYDYPVSQFAYDTDQSTAGYKATEGCTNYMLNQIIICNINGQGSIKYSCEVVACEPT